MASAEAPLAAVEEKNTKESGVLGRESGNAQSQLLSSTPIEMNDLSAVGQVASSSTAPQTSIFGGPTTTAESSLPHPDGALPESANDGSQGRNENVPQGRHTQLAPLNFQCEQREPLAPIPPNQPVSPIDASHPSLTRQKTAPQIGPATDKPLAPRESEVEGPFLYITLLLTTGERHPFRLDRKYLKKRGVQVENDNPINISLYKLKELILRDWREEWEAKPSSPESIRLISMGRLLSDKSKLSELGFKNVTTPTIVHMTIKPQEIVDEEDAKSNTRDREGNERSPGCRCVIQ